MLLQELNTFAPPPCTCSTIMQPILVGGGGNQRESAINGVLIALLLNAECIVLPDVSLVAVAQQEYGTRGRNSYGPPFDNRSQWNRFGMLFDAGFFKQKMLQIGLCPIDLHAGDVLPARVKRVSLSDQWTDHCWDRYRDLLLNESQALLLQNSNHSSRSSEHLQLNHHSRMSTSRGTARPPVLYTIRTGWELFWTRGQSLACWRLGALCGYATRSVRASPYVFRRAEQVLQYMLRQTTHWHAIHLRAWGWSKPCYPRDGNVGLIVNQTRRALPKPGVAGLYLVSERSSTGFVREGFRRHFQFVASKEDALERIRHEIPFEVAAQVDFEVGHALTARTGGIYFMTAVSSSDHFLATRRQEQGLPRSQTVCYDGQLCTPHGARCPASATDASQFTSPKPNY